MFNINYGYRVSGIGYRGRVGIALVSSVALMAAACGGGAHAPEAVVERDPITVQVQAVTKAPRAAMVEAGGLVQARTTAVVTSRLMAPVREVRVAPGDQVRAGQVLVVLDDRDLGAQARSAQSAALAAEQSVTAGGADRQAAEAGLALAKASHARVSLLHGRKSATTQELDEATASLRAAEARVAAIDARVQQAQASLASARAGSEAATVTASFAVITAPFAGVVTEKLVEPGNMATPGSPLVRLEERGALRLDVRVDASRVTGVAIGQEVDVALDAGEPLLLHGTVSEVARAMDADARAYLVKITLPTDARLRSGMFGRARFPGPTSEALLVPPGAVVRRGQITALFIAEGEVARLRMVILGRTFHEGVEVVSGLSEGERIVTTPPPTLADGAPIRTGAK
jgi:RND family efflux transporter MFP subunit